MANIPQKIVHQYLRHDKKFPHVWCAGCSNGIILGAVIRAIASMNLNRDDIVMVSGIGCSSRMPVYIDVDTLHTLHGRAIAFATGIKLHKPHMKVIVVTGDGDCTAIGGNHLIHAARRNIDLSVILVNNNIYGMTGGQCSPTTPHAAISTTSPYGNIEPDFNICNLALGAGASFVARTTAFHVTEMQNYIQASLEHPGFSLIEVISACPVIYGRLNKKGGAPQMMTEFRDNSVPLTAVEKLPKEQVEGKIVRGILRKDIRPEYTAEYAALQAYAQKLGGESDGKEL
ncbi:MAG: 2-oxoacid:ferredoxin oxidoreductase subunit beta [Candidatus Cloacimonadaceae bacterium]|jgi:2-oxoglutarate ferredoxin oxidoreductase subunit beta|nr:2-oxoacid:ferredoxin oxidoreductase subunit beta [Candidatus Cloacimonadota bacterium]MDY0127173.1 2-oxoacid:ferredoxin oxidoreductase subunit beta [Candidatus Cloacimonadaceae bacterium]MCB5254428.1 2-oxoacid:ferredoxin oxidoreductase subunit beta [Candidatus Cloacimonadota bacterium]MCK9178102.1 2-oxoacid:ferredoxin oxidoreductase subunit beta [Candidatus Cloacimonadota bacterium]MCK9241843.1 2-oxoacid:ferredoxin oxidoreductase subunit beta [Candidatus Cloacimonadota bacterium]